MMRNQITLFFQHIFVLLYVVAMSVFPVSGRAAISQNTTFSLRFNLPTCNVEVPPEYFLGTLHDGEHVFPEFALRVRCDKGGNSVKVLASTPNPLNVDNNIALVNGTSEFWLIDKGNNKRIDLSGLETAPNFCVYYALSGGGDCKVIPVVKINPGDPRGEFRINTIFSVYYY
ncbi:hypothetical protein ACFDZX_004326 [Salmonella enterica]